MTILACSLQSEIKRIKGAKEKVEIIKGRDKQII